MANNLRKEKRSNFSYGQRDKSEGILTTDGKAIFPEKVRVISETGENLDVLTLEKAVSMAKSLGLDLVLVSDKKIPIPVAKIMNFSKKLYEEKKKKNLAKKKNHQVQTKELRVSPKIGDNDLMIKYKQAFKFLKEGHRVKFVMVMRGREKSLKSTYGINIFAKVINFLSSEVDQFGGNLLIEDESENSWSVVKVFVLKKNK